MTKGRSWPPAPCAFAIAGAAEVEDGPWASGLAMEAAVAKAGGAIGGGGAGTVASTGCDVGWEGS